MKKAIFHGKKGASESLLFTLLIFMFALNTFIALWALSESSNIGLSFPSLPDHASLFDYFDVIWGYIVTFFQLAFFTVASIPIWLIFIIVVIDATIIFIIVKLIRGGG
jgi:hypothetical protein